MVKLGMVYYYTILYYCFTNINGNSDMLGEG